MSSFVIHGGHKLSGSQRVHGAKNSVLPIMAAAILNGRKSLIHNCPYLSDVESSIRILRHLGCKVERQGDVVCIDSGSMDNYNIPDGLMREMRSSVVFLGAILARAGEAVMSFPGGCELGPRPIDLHLQALRELGTDIEENGGNLFCKAEKLVGQEINLTFPSVGATENIMLVATAAQGTTCITNAAREPEIEDLQDFLIKMGGQVSGAGSSTIIIEGAGQTPSERFHEVEHSIIPDRIVASTLMACVAMAGGDVTLRDVNPQHVRTVISILSEAGCEIDVQKTSLRIRRSRQLKAMRPMKTQPYPGFPTDAQSSIMAVATRAEGTTVFVENIFESRFRHVGELTRMSADIKVEGRVAVVCGVPKLYGTRVHSTDLRGGAALVIAGLGAEGETIVTELHHIDRGYEAMNRMLADLGADIRRV